MTVKLRTHFSLFFSSTNIQQRPVQRADHLCSHHGLLPRFQPLSTDRGPCFTGQHGSPTTMVSGHCHLPHNDQLPTLPVGAERV